MGTKKEANESPCFSGETKSLWLFKSIICYINVTIKKFI